MYIFQINSNFEQPILNVYLNLPALPNKMQNPIYVN